MYLEVDEGFLEHPKTLQLCSTMRNPLAFGYMLHFWKWATRCCKDGDLRGMDAYAIEEAARYPQHDGKLYGALIAKLGDNPGFIDVDQDGNPTGIHNWAIRTGGAIKRMDDKARVNRERREAARAERQRETVPESYRNRTGTEAESSRQKSDQDKTSPDQSSPENTLPPRAIPGTTEPKRYTGWTLLQLFGDVRRRVLEIQPPPGAGNPVDANGKAQAFSERLADEAQEDVEPSMVRYFEAVKAGDGDKREASHPSFAFGCWMSRFEAVREELHGRAPKVQERADHQGERTMSRMAQAKY